MFSRIITSDIFINFSSSHKTVYDYSDIRRESKQRTKLENRIYIITYRRAFCVCVFSNREGSDEKNYPPRSSQNRFADVMLNRRSSRLTQRHRLHCSEPVGDRRGTSADRRNGPYESATRVTHTPVESDVLSEERGS